MGARESVSDDEPHVESSSLGSSLGAPNKAKGGTPSKRGPPRKRGPKPGDDYDRPQRRSAALAAEEEDLERLLRQREAAKLKEVLPSKVSKTAVSEERQRRRNLMRPAQPILSAIGSLLLFVPE
eukprot:scaffold6348_cov259-Pinguiococcus_pyrenoidosus.AAC.19